MLEEPWFVRRVLEQLAQHGATPEALNLELNETALVMNRAKVRVVVEQLRAAGIGLSIDDFGAGFTSFASLKEFDAQEIKLGHSILTDLAPGSFNAALVQSLCVFCAAQHIDFVAQGWKTLCSGRRCKNSAAAWARATGSRRPCRPALLPHGYKVGHRQQGVL